MSVPILRAMLPLAIARRARALWWLIGLAAIVAVAVGIVATYRVQLSPFAVEQKVTPYGSAVGQLFIDSGRSAIGDASVAPDTLTSRGPIYAAIANADDVKDEIAEEVGLPREAFEVYAQRLSATSTATGPTALETTAPTVVLASGVSPLIAVRGQAPTEELATRLVDATQAALADYVRRQGADEGVAERDRITLRPLGDARGSVVGETASPGDVVPVALAVWAALVVLLLAVDALRRQAKVERKADGMREEPLAPA